MAGIGHVAGAIQRMEQKIQQLQRQQQPQQKRAIGDAHKSTLFCQNRSHIYLPAVEREEFKIKPYLIELVDQNSFHGSDDENPIDHLKNLEAIGSTICMSGVLPEFVACKLFAFSLAGKAFIQLKLLPSGFLTTWEKSRSIFLNHFYTRSKTAVMRKKITTFHQHLEEPFYEAWQRFKDYRMHCPHHGFSDEKILDIFQDGVSWDYQNILDAASNGSFTTQTKEGAHQLIENLAASSRNRCHENELNATDDLMLMRNQRSVKFCEDTRDNALCHIFQGGLQKDHPLDTFQAASPASFQAPERDYMGELNILMQNLVQSQQMLVQSQKDNLNAMHQKNIDRSTKLGGMYNDLNSKFEAKLM